MPPIPTAVRASLTGAMLVALSAVISGCTVGAPGVPLSPAIAGSARLEDLREDEPAATPEDEGLDSRSLIGLTEWIRDHPAPIFSLLISRRGRLVYELYTSALTRAHAHYQMSATKSVLSALVGAAIDRGLIAGPDDTVARILPRRAFASDADAARFRRVTVKHVLGMSTLDAPDPPRVTTPDAVARHQRFRNAPDRLAFALAQPLLSVPGRGFQYNDVTPMLAVGLVQYATGRSALEFAEDCLFRPMRFRNYEWMHQDRAGFDLGGFGLRLRPIDMQKFGVLYLNGGTWGGNRLISAAWVQRSFTPWNRSHPDAPFPDYGWYWWQYDGRSGWTAHVAIGWKGQRIAVLPRQDLVVTMTADIEDGGENALFNDLVDRFVVPAVRSDGPRPRDPGTRARLDALLEEVRQGPSRVAKGTEARMIPSVSPKDRHVRFGS